MSYRDRAQSIEEPAIQAVEGIDSFVNAAKARIRSENWTDEHVADLMDVAKGLLGVRLKLLRLARDNW
jgi:hypothetical protein